VTLLLAAITNTLRIFLSNLLGRLLSVRDRAVAVLIGVFSRTVSAMIGYSTRADACPSRSSRWPKNRGAFVVVRR